MLDSPEKTPLRDRERDVRCACAHAQSYPTLWRLHGLDPSRTLCPWNFPGKNTGVGCYFLLQGIFPTQGSNPSLLHCMQTLYLLNHQSEVKVTQSSPTLCDPMDYTVHGLLGLPHCRRILYQLSHKGSQGGLQSSVSHVKINKGTSY